MFSKESASTEIEEIARKFFQFNFTSCNIVKATLEDNRWYVKASVTLYEKQSSRTLVIDSKTGRIISSKRNLES